MKLPKPLQVTRRSVQMLALLLILITPILARYANRLNAAELDHLLEEEAGSPQAKLLEGTDWVLRNSVVPDIEVDGRMRRDDEAAVDAASAVMGSSWAFEAFGVRFTDPLGALESMLSSGRMPRVLWIGLLLPLVLTLLFGRVFCSWLCPVGTILELTDGLRRVLKRVGMKPGRTKLWSGDKYLVLVVGLALTVSIGLPLLGSFYPPALFGREVESGFAVFFDAGEAGVAGLTAAGLSLASWFLLGIVFVELAFAPRMWCRALCPGGALYAVLGWLRPVRVRLDKSTCTDCGDCNVACGMGLDPMHDAMGVDCDNCGVCIASCPEGSLSIRAGVRAARPQPLRDGDVEAE
jgi:ferredoxin-type protein NapH